MGLNPPESLLSAIRFPPKRIALTPLGQPPLKRRFEKSVSALIRAGAVSLWLRRSSKWLGLNPSGPPAEPAGKERIASSTSGSVTWSGFVEAGSGSSRSLEEQGSTGCFSRKMSRLCALGIAGLLCSHRMRTAARMLPSSSLELTAVIRASDRRGRPSEMGREGSSIQHPAGSRTQDSTRPLIILAKLRLCPALGGLAKMKGAKPSKALQTSEESGVVHMPLRIETRAREHDARAPLQ